MTENATKNQRKTTLILTGILLEVIKKYYSQDKERTYVDNRKETKIDIQPSYAWAPEHTQDRPGVYVQRGDMIIGNPRVGMDDIYHKDHPSGEIEHAVMVQVPWTVFCVSREVGEAEILGMDVFEILNYFAPIIRRDFTFDRFGVSRVGAVGQLDESKEHWVVPVGVNGTYNELWPIRPEALKLGDIKLRSAFEIE